MKTIIKVTIKEFIENGGILNLNREIFNEGKYPIGTFLKFDEKLNVNLCKNDRFKSFPITDQFHFVEIECTPIYK